LFLRALYLPPGNSMPPFSPSVLKVYLGFNDNSEKEKTSPGSRLLPINPS